MLVLSSILVAVLFGLGAWLMLRRNLVEVLFGVALLSHGANLVLIISGGWAEQARPPVVVEKGVEVAAAGEAVHKVSQVDPAAYADPLPQALILTAMVIGFGLLSFLAILVSRAARATETLETGELDDPGEIIR